MRDRCGLSGAREDHGEQSVTVIRFIIFKLVTR